MGVISNDQVTLQSLPLLQDRIKKDPEAYREEFNLQFEHFESSLEIFAASPQKPEKSFHELVMFIAHVSESTAQSTAQSTAHINEWSAIVWKMIIASLKSDCPVLRKQGWGSDRGPDVGSVYTFPNDSSSHSKGDR